jgi:hypothetical protein
MQELMTHVNIPEIPFKIDYSSHLFFIGSCFADVVGKRMNELKFPVCHNPFGVVYNPVSLAFNLKLLAEKEQFTEEDLSFYNELWFSFSHYTLFSDIDKQNCLDKINTSFYQAREFISKTDVMVITLGTSWVYALNETGKVVANCHKLPASKFNRYFSSAENSTKHLREAIQQIREKNPSIRVIFSVSPVRHWKDGAIENQRSKAALIISVATLQHELENVYYFPAYEICMDELRDYRFYANDMLHPSEVAIDYIWDRFAKSFLGSETFPIIKNVEAIISSLKHKPRNIHTLAYQQFHRSLIEKMEYLQQVHPFLDFQKELVSLKKNVQII